MDGRGQSSASPTLSPRGKGRGQPSTSAEKKREQGRLRSKRFRDASKKSKEAERSNAVAAEESMRAELGLRRFGNYRVKENVDWIVRVGTAPSAAAARSPLAGIIANVCARSTNRWSVDLYRDRLYRYYLHYEEGISNYLLDEGVVGYSLQFDETPTRLFVPGSGAMTTKTLVRSVRMYGGNGHLRNLLPTLSRPADGSWPAMLAAIDVPSLRLESLAGDGSSWTFLLIVVDGAPVNGSIVRAIAAYCRRFPRMIVTFGICWSHVLSNGTKWSLGRQFPFGQFLRISHVLQAKPVKDILSFCMSRLSPDAYVADERLEEVGAVVWGFFLERFFSSKGPFSEVGTQAGLPVIVAECCRLWPRGPPRPDDLWLAPVGCGPDDYAAMISKLFRRTVPTPLLSRWYSVENFGRYLLGYYRMRLFNHVFPEDSRPLRYWPGDNPAAPLINPSRYEAQSRNRLQRMRRFIFSESFVDHVLTCAISSIPRFEFARHLFSGDPDVDGLVGIASACAAVLRSTRSIFAGGNVTVEYFLCDDFRSYQIRLAVYRALVVSIVFLAERNMPYTTAGWRIIRGESPAHSIRDVLKASDCCADAGMLSQARLKVEGLSGAPLSIELTGLMRVFKALRLAYTTKGGPANLESESYFSHLRALGLKLPYRPMTLAVARRELANRIVRRLHRTWYEDFVVRHYGSLRNMRRACLQVSPRVNGFTAFCRAAKVRFEVGLKMWEFVTDVDKSKWSGIAAAANASATTGGGVVAAAGECGPFGSRHRYIPVSVDDVYEALNSDDRSLVESWTKAAVREFRCGAEEESAFRLCREDIGVLRSILLPGEKCAACKKARKEPISGMAGVWAVVNEAFQSESVAVHGIVCGCSIEGEIFWFDVAHVQQKPRRMLCVPLDTIDWYEHEDVDCNRSPRSARCTLPDAFDGRSLCLMDFIGRDRRQADFVFAVEKLGVLSGNEGWVLVLSRSPSKHKLVASKTARARPNTRKSASLAGGLSAREFARMFGDDEGVEPIGPARDSHAVSDVEAEDSDVSAGSAPIEDAVFVADTLSDEELLSAQGAGAGNAITTDNAAGPKLSKVDQALLMDRVSRGVNPARYGVSVHVHDGNIVVFWHAEEKGRRWGRYVETCRRLKRMAGAADMTSSKSSSWPKHSLESCERRSADWQAWHSAWLYGTRPSRPLPSSMKLPPDDEFRADDRSVAPSSCAGDSGADSGSEVVSAVISSDSAASSSISDTSSGTDPVESLEHVG